MQEHTTRAAALAVPVNRTGLSWPDSRCLLVAKAPGHFQTSSCLVLLPFQRHRCGDPQNLMLPRLLVTQAYLCHLAASALSPACLMFLCPSTTWHAMKGAHIDPFVQRSRLVAKVAAYAHQPFGSMSFSKCFCAYTNDLTVLRSGRLCLGAQLIVLFLGTFLDPGNVQGCGAHQALHGHVELRGAGAMPTAPALQHACSRYGTAL